MKTRTLALLLATLLVVTVWGCGELENPVETSKHLSSAVLASGNAMTDDLGSLMLWNRLGSDEEVTNSPSGPNGQIVGALQYLPGQHDNGFTPQPRAGDHNIPDNYVKFEGLGLGQQGCIEFWYLPDWDSPAVGHIVEVLHYMRPEDVNSVRLHIQYNDWQDLLSFSVEDRGRSEFVQRSVRPRNVPQWSTEHPFHVAITWDGSAAALEDRLKLFFDGTEVGGSFFHRGDPRFDNWEQDLTLGVGTRLHSGDWDRHKWEGDGGVIDNIKIWGFPKTDFSDRFVEAPTFTVDLDVKPGSCPNPLNMRSGGVLPVAVLGTDAFDVSMIDVETLRLAGVAPEHGEFEDVSTPIDGADECECTEAGADGFNDLIMYFEKTDIIQALGEVSDGETVTLMLTGELLNGVRIEGVDCVKIIKRGRGRVAF